MSTRAGRLRGAILGLAGSILVLLGFVEPWLPAKIHTYPLCGSQFQHSGCLPDYYSTTTVTFHHVIQSARSWPDAPSPAFLLIPLVLAVVPLPISLFALARVPARHVLALDAAAVLLGSLALLALCWYAAYGNPGPYIVRQSDTSQLAHQLAPTLWLFLGYALIWGGWWLLTRARRAATAAKGT